MVLLRFKLGLGFNLDANNQQKKKKKKKQGTRR